MAGDTEAVVMICGPHHEAWDSSRKVSCPAIHDGTRCFSRVDHAVREVRAHLGTVLIISGDANEGRDVSAFAARARAAGVANIREAIWTGPGSSHTQQDIRLALDLLVRDASLAGVDTVCLVTDPWHMQRATLMAQAEILEAKRPDQSLFSLRTSKVFAHWTPPKAVLERERSGSLAFTEGQYARGLSFSDDGKPVPPSLTLVRSA